MPSLLGQSQLASFRMQQAVSGVALTISRGVSTAAVTGVPGETEYVHQDRGPSASLEKTRDFLIAVSDYSIGTEPAAGDRAVEGTRTYEAMIVDGEQCWRWHDREYQIYRIHYKRVA